MNLGSCVKVIDSRPISPDSGYAWYVVSLLTLASIISYLDRQILAMMIGPVRRDLGISDVQVSLLLGLAFTLLFTLTTLPAARLADQMARRIVIGTGIFVWSLMTSASGVAQTYLQLFLARMGVGIGEATLSPASYSLMSDLFSAARLPVAAGLFQSATFVGTGLAYLLGGPLVDYLEGLPAQHVPIVGELRSWQLTFLIVGTPGLLLSIVLFKIREPVRRGRIAAAGSAPIPLRQIGVFMRERWRFFTLHFVGYLLMATQGFALFAWSAEYLIRTHGFARAEAGIAFGTVALLLGIVGSMSGGIISSLFVVKGKGDGMMRLGMYKCIVIVPFAVAFGLAPAGALAIAALVPLVFLMSLTPGLGAAVLQVIAPNEMRAQMVAVYGVCVSFLSYLLAPLMVAMMTQYVFGADDAVGLSLAVLAAVCYPVAAVSLGLGLRHFRSSIELARAWSS